jgi:hypothetical protein
MESGHDSLVQREREWPVEKSTLAGDTRHGRLQGESDSPIDQEDNHDFMQNTSSAAMNNKFALQSQGQRDVSNMESEDLISSLSFDEPIRRVRPIHSV